MMSWMWMFFALLMAHALTDYAWQPEFMAQWKHPDAFIPPSAGHWTWWMAAHSLVNGAGVAVVTGSLALGLGETAYHAFLDYGKCVEWWDTSTDQECHLVSKVLWAWLATAWIV